MDVNRQKLVKEISKELKSKIAAPEWASFVKTGHGKQRPPVDKDWWYMRAASVLLKVQKLGPIGTSKLSSKYSTNKNRGVKPEKTADASRNIIRKILQQLEDIGLIQKDSRGVRKGRVLTKAGNDTIIKASKALSK